MAKTKITAPVAVPGDHVGVGGLVFTDGVAETDDPAIIGYAERHGYGVGHRKPTGETVEDLPDSRDIHADSPVMVGTLLRDAAVDPKPEDYLPPVNAGKADPHGPEVVAPQLHGAGVGPIAPGAVTEDKEAALAEAVLVDGQDVGEATQAQAGDNTGPLDLSDPSSGEFADTGIASSDGAVEPAQPATKTAAKKTTARTRKR